MYKETNMRTLLVVVALLVVSTLAFAQGEIAVVKYYVPLAGTAVDTVPGTHTGGTGAGGAGWLNVGMAEDIVYSLVTLDSLHFTVHVDYSDTGYASATGTSARTIGFNTYAVNVGGSTDSVTTIPTGGLNPMDFESTILRQFGGTDNIPNGRWIRFRVTRIAGAAAVADNTIRLSIYKRRFAQN